MPSNTTVSLWVSEVLGNKAWAFWARILLKCSPQALLRSTMGSIFGFRQSPRVSLTQELRLPPAKATKDFPFLSLGLSFKYPPSHKSVRKRSHFLSKESGVQNSLYGKTKPQQQLRSTFGVQRPAYFSGLLFQLPNTFQSVKFISPPL